MIIGSLKIFSGNSNIPLVQDICNKVGIPLAKATVDRFPNGETCVEIHDNIRGADVFVVQSTNEPANHNIMELLILIDAIKRASAARITAVIPFYGYARQDRKSQPRVPISAKLVANLLSVAGVSRVLTMDLHSQQIVGFFDIPLDHLYAAPVFLDYLKRYRQDNLTVCSPDSGGTKMAWAYAQMLNCPLAMVVKKRKSPDIVEAVDLIGQVEGRDVLIVDDMAESAGTVISAAKLLKEKGAVCVRAAICHGVLHSKGYDRLKKSPLDEIIVTNSTHIHPVDSMPITVLSVSNLFAEAILRIHRNESLASLFKINDI